MKEVEQLYQETILEHGQNPRNFGAIRNANFSAEFFNPLCGDHYWVYLKINRGAIKNISFEGEGCLISKASASLMTQILKNKKIKEAKAIFGFFQKLVKKELSSLEGAGKLAAFSGIYKFPARIQCALLPWYIIRKKF